MKRIHLLVLAIVMSAGSCTQQSNVSDEVGKANLYDTVPYVKASPEKMQWFNDAKFGMFIHWGVYAVPAGYWSEDNTFESRFALFMHWGVYSVLGGENIKAQHCKVSIQSILPEY